MTDTPRRPAAADPTLAKALGTRLTAMRKRPGHNPVKGMAAKAGRPRVWFGQPAKGGSA